MLGLRAAYKMGLLWPGINERRRYWASRSYTKVLLFFDLEL
jgi:hypothetical protein